MLKQKNLYNAICSSTILIGALLLLVTACANPYGNSSFTRDELGYATDIAYGTVLSTQQVAVEGTESGIGIASGAIIGGLAGSTVGGAEQSTIAASIAGALIGGLLGDFIEKNATSSEATLFVIEKEDGDILSLVEIDTKNITAGMRVILIDVGRIKIYPAPAGATQNIEIEVEAAQSV